MSQTRIIGLIAPVAGAVLLVFAWRASNAPLDQMSEALTGRYTGNTMWYALGGVVVGTALLFRGSA